MVARLRLSAFANSPVVALGDSFLRNATISWAKVRFCSVANSGKSASVAGHTFWSPPGLKSKPIRFMDCQGTSLVIGYARAACMIAAESRGIPCFEYKPSTVKRAVTSTGSADKHTVSIMVGAILGAKQPIQEDQADALATAICHLNQTRHDVLMASIRMGDSD